VEEKIEVIINGVAYEPKHPDRFQEGVLHACKMLPRYMRRENMDLLDMGSLDLLEIVEAETNRMMPPSNPTK